MPRKAHLDGAPALVDRRGARARYCSNPHIKTSPAAATSGMPRSNGPEDERLSVKSIVNSL
jgi:hypothetical protein